MLGFSQGAAVVTKVIYHLLSNNIIHSIKFVILIGGVSPSEIDCNVSRNIMEYYTMFFW